MADSKSRDKTAPPPAGIGKQRFTDTPGPDDLIDNPGIGTTRGVAAGNPDDEDIDGEATFEGDVENDVTANGEVNPNQTGRTNK